jgi:hypothetical protein
MEKTQVYLRKEELAALREAAARSGRSVAEVVRDAIRKVVLKPQTTGLVAIWDGEPKRTSIDHDSVHDEPWCGMGKQSLSIAGRGSRLRYHGTRSMRERESNGNYCRRQVPSCTLPFLSSSRHSHFSTEMRIGMWRWRGRSQFIDPAP